MNAHESDCLHKIRFTYRPIAEYLRALSPDGIYVVAGGSILQLFQAGLKGRRTSKTGNRKTHVISLVQSQTDLAFLKELLESGKVVPVIDGCYPLSKTDEALRHFEKEHAQGKIVITVEHYGSKSPPCGREVRAIARSF